MFSFLIKKTSVFSNNFVWAVGEDINSAGSNFALRHVK